MSETQAVLTILGIAFLVIIAVWVIAKIGADGPIEWSKKMEDDEQDKQL